jgi:MarR family transcriptional regulator, organic hydroperoxide resistance regulator
MPDTRENAARAMDALRRVVRSLHGAHARARQEAGLSAAALFVLREVAAAPGLSVRELAQRTGTSMSAVSEVVRRVASMGLIRRETSDRDGRRASLALTPLGRVIAERSPQTVQERLLAAYRLLEPAEQATLANVLEAWLALAGLDNVRPRMFFERRPARLGTERR